MNAKRISVISVALVTVLAITLPTASNALGKKKSESFRVYASCYNRSCSEGIVLKVYSNNKIQGIEVPGSEWGCLKGNLRSNYVTLASDYARFPRFGSEESYDVYGSWNDLEGAYWKEDFAWYGPMKKLSPKKFKSLKKKFNECATYHRWKKLS